MIQWIKKLFGRKQKAESGQGPSMPGSLYAFAFGKWQLVTPIATCGPMLRVLTESGEATVVGACNAADAIKFKIPWDRLAGPQDEFVWEDGTPYEL